MSFAWIRKRSPLWIDGALLPGQHRLHHSSRLVSRAWGSVSIMPISMWIPGPLLLSFAAWCHCGLAGLNPLPVTEQWCLSHPRPQDISLSPLGLQGCQHPQWWLASGSLGSTHAQALTLILSRGQEAVSLRPLYFSLHLSEILYLHNWGAWIYHHLNPSLEKIIQEAM